MSPEELLMKVQELKLEMVCTGDDTVADNFLTANAGYILDVLDDALVAYKEGLWG